MFEKSFRGAALLCLLLSLAPAQAQDVGRVYKEGRISISINKEGDRISVSAKEVPRRELFAVLRGVFNIEVRPVDGADETISVEFSDQPLERGVAQLLPKDSRFIVRTQREPTGQPDALTKEGPKVEPGDKPKKPREGSLGIVTEGPRKPPPRSVVPPKDVEIKGGKPLAKASLDVPHSKGAKVPMQTDPVPAQAVRLTFILRSSGELVLTRAQPVEGAVPVSRLVQGPFVFIVRDSKGAVRYFETQQHPLSQHSYLPNGIHDQTRAKEGIFGVWLPKELALRGLASLRLQFIDAQNVTLPAELDERSIYQLMEQAKPVAELNGEEVLRVLKGSAK
jgi:hypothetical protein